ncbi:MAG: aconitase X, partial [Rhodospirillales bacterium]
MPFADAHRSRPRRDDGHAQRCGRIPSGKPGPFRVPRRAAYEHCTPYANGNVPENRLGQHRIHVEVEMVSVLDWGMLGYLTGAQVEEDIPVLTGIEAPAGLIRHKHFGAAAASSGGVEMYHAAGMTPEADTEEQAFGSKKPVQDLHYGPRERRRTYDTINGNAHATDVDYIMLGCPRYTIERIWEAARLLDGKRVSENCALWIFTAAAVKDVADRN